MELRFQVYGKIAKPVAEVFDAVYNPSKLSGYFTTGGASAPLVEGSTVTWDFADFPGAFPVQVRKVEQNRLIELEWKAGDGDYSTRTGWSSSRSRAVPRWYESARAPGARPSRGSTRRTATAWAGPRCSAP